MQKSADTIRIMNLYHPGNQVIVKNRRERRKKWQNGIGIKLERCLVLLRTNRSVAPGLSSPKQGNYYRGTRFLFLKKIEIIFARRLNVCSDGIERQDITI